MRGDKCKKQSLSMTKLLYNDHDTSSTVIRTLTDIAKDTICTPLNTIILSRICNIVTDYIYW